MKRIFFSILVIALAFSCGEDKTKVESSVFSISGKLTESSGEEIFLESLSPEGVKLLDTTTIDEKGEFVFQPDSIETGFYNIKITNNNFITIILDGKQNIQIEGSARDLGNTYKVKGSKDAELFWQLNEVSKNNFRKRDSITRYYQAYINTVKMNPAKMDSMSKALEVPYNALLDQQNKYITEIIDANPTSIVCLAAVQQIDPTYFLPYYQKTAENLKQKYPNSTYVKFFVKNLEAMIRLSPGSPAPEITLNTPEDKPLSLSSLKGKVVLIDFWASWCKPCLAQVPDLKKMYDKYSSRGFEIFGVSLDKDKANWVQAIREYKMNWIHVSDLAYWNSPVVKTYNFNSIPLTYLIDKEGKIAATGLHGEQWEKAIEELLSK